MKLRLKTKQIITLSTLLVVVGLIIFASIQVYNHLLALKASAEHLVVITEELNLMYQKKDLDIVRAKSLIDKANNEIQEIQVEVKPYYGILKMMSSVPGIGEYFGQAEPIIEYASHTLSAVKILVDLVEPIVNSPIYAERSSQLVQQINSNQDLIKSSSDHIQQANDYYQLIQKDLYPENIQRKLEKINQLQPLLQESITLLKLVPDLTGADKPVTYLIMLQNSDELRPTGGFITAFGLVRLEKGRVTALEFNNTDNNYISQIVDAPEPLKQILLAHYWLPRDANWSPSFPESAKQVQNLFYLSSGIKTDGVIALNQSSIEKILLFTGPVSVNGESVSGENVKEYMIKEKMDAIQKGNYNNRKEFITSLVKALIEQISQLSGKENLINLAKLFQNLTTQGDLLMYSNQKDIQILLQKYHFDGELIPGEGDYLMLVDSNLYGGKLDSVIQRDLSYSVDLTDPKLPSSSILVSYKNPMEGESICKQGEHTRIGTVETYNFPTCYCDYWRILGVKGTNLSGYDVPEFSDYYFQEGYGWSHLPKISAFNENINEVAGLLILSTASDSSISLERELPPSVLIVSNNKVTYTLNIQKQPGIDKLPFEIKIAIPSGIILDSIDSDIQLTRQNNEWIWQGLLSDTLTEIQVSYSLE